MRSLLFLVCASFLASCSAPSPSQYTIEGPYNSEFDGQMVYLNQLDLNGKYSSIDSTKVVNGVYSFTGEAPTPFIGQISTQSSETTPSTVIVEPGDITVSLGITSYAKGTVSNDSLQSYQKRSALLLQQRHQLSKQLSALKSAGTLTPALEDSLYAQASVIYNDVVKTTKQFVQNNAQNLAGLFVLSTNMHSFSYPEVKAIVTNFPATLQTTTLYSRVKDRETALARREPGAMFTDVKIPNLNGQEDALSNYIGKGDYVLVDFWASWCAPCRREMPFVVEAYEKFNPKGLEIVGVSLDQNKQDWENAVKQMKMSWPQLSDLNGWKAEAAAVYGINSIPTTILFDPQGKVIAVNLRGEALEEKLASLLN